MKILLVEDNPVDRMFVTQSLRQVEGFDYELVDCESLADAMEQVVAAPYDVILLDLWLPDCEGLETCHRLVAVVDKIPIVVMTGTDDRTLATEAMRSGAQDYLVKGAFPGSAIARVLQYAIDRYHFQRERVQQDNHFQEVLSRVPAIIWTTDLALEIKSALGAGLQFLHLDPQQIVGKTLEEYFRITGDAEATVRAHQRALDGQSVAFETEWLGRHFEVKIDPLHEPNRSVSGTIGVALDVTERRKLDREITFARLVQEALLPAEHPHLEGFDIFGGSYPATQTCGDWFDYLMFPDGSLGLVAGDVSGHGFGPAILSATMAAYLEVLAENHSDVQEILNACNRLVCKRSMDGQFAVLSLARLQPGVRTLTFGGAGDGMLIVSRDGLLKQKVSSSGMPFGVVDDIRYESPAQVALEPGDVLLLLTDGFREAQNEAGDLFGESRVIETVAANSHASASEIFKALWRATRKFADGHHQQDDMTGIVVKVLDARSTDSPRSTNGQL
ncbi:MAG: SpoIIE family protein phosphatase [Planctomycetaceae bacterium]